MCYWLADIDIIGFTFIDIASSDTINKQIIFTMRRNIYYSWFVLIHTIEFGKNLSGRLVEFETNRLV